MALFKIRRSEGSWKVSLVTARTAHGAAMEHLFPDVCAWTESQVLNGDFFPGCRRLQTDAPSLFRGLDIHA
jgi:hypothetical protein